VAVEAVEGTRRDCPHASCGLARGLDKGETVTSESGTPFTRKMAKVLESYVITADCDRGSDPGDYDLAMAAIGHIKAQTRTVGDIEYGPAQSDEIRRCSKCGQWPSQPEIITTGYLRLGSNPDQMDNPIKQRGYFIYPDPGEDMIEVMIVRKT